MNYQLGSSKIDDRRNHGGDDNPEELIPVEKRNAKEFWTSKVVKRGPEQGDEGKNEE
jgi:hypothetical protein